MSPKRPKKPCNHPGCPELVEAGQGKCEKHRKQHNKLMYKEHGKSRSKTKERGYGGSHRKLRKMVMAEEPLCRHCLERGKLTPSREMDHIDGDPWNLHRDNLQMLCKPCHSRKTAREDGAFDSLQFPKFKKPSCCVVMVCGPPGAGKSSYVSERATPHDLVIDLDHIRAAVTGTPLYHSQDADSLDKALSHRNRMLRGLHRRAEDTVYIIITGARKSDRDWWQDRLGAEIVILDTDLEECLRRIDKDERRTEEVKKLHKEIARAWWLGYGPHASC